jgi:hypothetical protein
MNRPLKATKWFHKSSEASPAMRVAYLTLDYVQGFLALRQAEEAGVTLCPLSWLEPSAHSRFDAVVYDLDSLSPGRRQQILGLLLYGAGPCLVGVHSDQLGPDEALRLQQNGVAVSHGVGKALFLRLVLRHARQGRRGWAAGLMDERAPVPAMPLRETAVTETPGESSSDEEKLSGTDLLIVS